MRCFGKHNITAIEVFAFVHRSNECCHFSRKISLRSPQQLFIFLISNLFIRSKYPIKHKIKNLHWWRRHHVLVSWPSSLYRPQTCNTKCSSSNWGYLPCRESGWWWYHNWSPSVVLFSPQHRLGHPDTCSFSLSWKITYLDQSIPKKKIEERSTAPRALVWVDSSSMWMSPVKFFPKYNHLFFG